MRFRARFPQLLLCTVQEVGEGAIALLRRVDVVAVDNSVRISFADLGEVFSQSFLSWRNRDGVLDFVRVLQSSV